MLVLKGSKHQLSSHLIMPLFSPRFSSIKNPCVCRDMAHAECQALYIAVHISFEVPSISADVNILHKSLKQIIYTAGRYPDQRYHGVQKSPRLHPPLFSDTSKCRRDYSKSRGSDSNSSLDRVGSPSNWVSKPNSMGIKFIRPRKWLSALFTVEFLDLFGAPNRPSRRTKGKKAFQERYTRLFVVDFPEDTCGHRRPRYRPAVRVHEIAPSTVEASRLYGADCSRHSYSEPQQAQVNRAPRQRTPIIERVPTRQGRRVSLMRASGTRQSMPRRMYHHDWAREVDGASVHAFRRDPVPYTSPRRSTIPRGHATFPQEDGGRYGIPIPAQSSFPHAERVPESPRIIRRSPRLPQEPPRPRARGVRLEERSPYDGVRIEERWPRTRPEVSKAGRLGRSATGADVVEQTRERPVRILLEKRSPRPSGLNRPRRYYEVL